MGRRDEWNDAETMTRRRDRSNEGFASACATLERAMRRLANEMTIRKTGRPRRGGPRERETGTRTERRSSPSLSSSLSSLSSLSSISSISSNVRETRVVDVDEAESVDAGTESTRGRRDEEKDERDVVRRLEMKCARLESTVVTLRRALEDRTRRRSNDASRDDDEDERDEAARDVLAHEIVVLRRCVKRASMERDRLLEMSNDLRAALHRSRAETRETRLKTHPKTPPPTTTSIPIVEAKPSIRASIALASIASSTSERETFSQRSKLKSAMRRAKERRAAAATVPAVRNWNRVRTSEANQ